MIRVVIVDDHPLIRVGIRAVLEKAPDIKVIGEASDGLEAVYLFKNLLPDVVVIDLAMPRLNGMQAIQQMKAADISAQIVVLSMYSDYALIQQAFTNGATGYVLKNSIAGELVNAIRVVTKGEFYTNLTSKEELKKMLCQISAERTTGGFSALSSREMEVLQLIAEGYTNQAMSRIMKISIKTVEKHRSNLMKKLNIYDVAGLVRAAIKNGIIFLDN